MTKCVKRIRGSTIHSSTIQSKAKKSLVNLNKRWTIQKYAKTTLNTHITLQVATRSSLDMQLNLK